MKGQGANVALWLLLVLFFTPTVLFGEDTHAPLKVGIIIPLSGPGASMGESVQGAFRLEQWKHIDLQYEDDQCDAKKALAAYYKLHAAGVKVYYIACSGSLMAIAPYVKQRGELIVTSYSGSAAVRETGPEVIRFNADAISVAEAMAKLVESDKAYRAYKKIALFYEEQDYASSLAELLKKRLAGRIVSEETYLATQPTFKSQITKLAHKGLDLVIYIPVSEVPNPIFLRELKEQGWKVPLLGDVNVCDLAEKPESYSIHGACFSAIFDTPGYAEFLKKYESVNGRKSGYPYYDAIAYDIARALDAYSATHSDLSPAALIAEILKGVHGLVSEYTFTSDGEVVSGDKYLRLKAF